MLRLLQSAPKDPYGPSSTSSSSKNPDVPSLVIDIPTYGAVFMNVPEDPLAALDNPESTPRSDVLIHGELVIALPQSLGRRRIKGIKVGIKSVLKLDLGPGRMGEEDTLFERSLDLAECPECKMWLEPGSSVFDFTLILPAGHPPHDWHGNGSLRHTLYAEIEGRAKEKGKGKGKGIGGIGGMGKDGVGFLNFRSKSYGKDLKDAKEKKVSGSGNGNGHRSPSRGHASPSPPASRSTSPGPPAANRGSMSTGHYHPPRGLEAALMSQTGELSLREGPGGFMEKAPAYDVEDRRNGSGGAMDDAPEDVWLKGKYTTERTLMLIYNPCLSGDVTVLDLRFNGVAEDLGIWSLTLNSNPWTICALLKCRLNFTSLSPGASIYCFRLSLAQTHTIASPRDDPETTPPVTSTRTFTIYERGRRPPAENPFPKRDWPALWRGVEAGGKDTADFDLDVKGRLPNDDSGRPSTVPGVTTPIKVSHTLQIEIYFSIYGQDQRGQPMKMPGPGGSRLLKIHRPVIVPSCILIHQVLNLPSYDEHKAEAFSSKGINVACPVCGIRPSERLCRTCPAGLAPHPRHDHDPKVVGDASGRCRICSQGSFPTGSGFNNCACGMGIDQMEARMARTVQGEREERGEGEREGERMIRQKEENERGRTRQ